MGLEFLKGKYGFQLVAFLLVAFICMVILQLIGLALVFTTTSLTFSELGSIANVSVLKDKQDGYLILYILLITQSIGLFVLPGILFPKLIGNPVKNYFSVKFSKRFYQIALLPILAISGVVIVGFLGELNMRLDLPQVFHVMEQNATETVNYLLSFRDTNSIIATIFLMAIIPAIGEELFFRGVIQQIFIKWTRKSWVGILITAFIFSAIHFQFLTFLPRFFMGIMLGYLFVWSKNLIIPIIAHFLHNFISILVGLIAFESSEWDESINFIQIVGAFLVFSSVTFLFYRFSKRIHVS